MGTKTARLHAINMARTKRQGNGGPHTTQHFTTTQTETGNAHNTTIPRRKTSRLENTH